MHGACNNVLSALVVHDRYRDSNAQRLQQYAFKSGPLKEAKQPLGSPVTVTSLKTPVTNLLLQRKRRLGNHDLTTGLIGRRSHQKKKRCKTCSHGRHCESLRLPTDQPFSKHRHGCQSSPWTSHGIAGRSDQLPLPPIQASSSVCCEAPDLKPRSCTVTCTYVGPLPSAADHKTLDDIDPLRPTLP